MSPKSRGALLPDPANQEAFQELIKTLREDRPLALVGAGSSARLGYPGWNQLLELLAAEIRRLRPKADAELKDLAGDPDALWRAEEYRRLLGDGFGPFMRSTFDRRATATATAYDGFHQDLVRLPIAHVLTTNYDPVLEEAHVAVFRQPARVVEWKDQADMREFIERAAHPGFERRYVYLHGRYNAPETLVLTENDYKTHYAPHGDAWQRLFALLATRRLVSFGFSLSDWDFMAVFREVQARLGAGGPRHFALLASDGQPDPATVRRRLRGKFGVEPVFYRYTKDHAGLWQLVQQLHTELAPPKTKTKTKASSPDDPSSPRPDPDFSLTERLAPGPEGADEFRRLVQALLRAHAQHHGFDYVYNRERAEWGGLVGYAPRGGVPGLEGQGVVSFAVHHLTEPFDWTQVGVFIHHVPAETDPVHHVVFIFTRKLTAQEEKRLRRSQHPRGELRDRFQLHVWGPERIRELLRECPALEARYAAEDAQAHLAAGGRLDFSAQARRYGEKVADLYDRLRTLGLPPEALRERDARPDIRLRDVFVPLRLLPDGRSDRAAELAELLYQGHSVVVRGDPGTGKTTLLYFLALLCAGRATLPGYAAPQGRVPLFIPLRDFVRLQKDQPDLTFLGYLEARARSDLQLSEAHRFFFESALRMGDAVVLLDGLDEVGRASGRQRIARAIEAFRRDFPDCPFWVTSRIYGYTADVRLPTAEFTHYRLAPLGDSDIVDFVTRWYALQLSHNPREREERIASLTRAIAHTPSVRRLAGNPLLLTLTAFIHHGLKQLPQGRGELYDKCIEMLLRTWQEAKYEDGTPPAAPPAELPPLPLQTQRDYLAHLALRAQERHRDTAPEDARGLIPRSEAEACLAERHHESARRTRPDLTPAQARDEMKLFIDYISDRTGLLLDRGDGQLSFIHLSFQEYLAASVFTYRSEPPQERVDFFLRHLGKPAWEEVLLLRLYVIQYMPGGGGTEPFDAVVSALLARLHEEDMPAGWLTLARALRDNLAFRTPDTATIVARLLDLWTDKPTPESTWSSALEELCLLSSPAREAIRSRLGDACRHAPPERIVAWLHLQTRLFQTLEDEAALLASRPDLDPILPDLVALQEVPGIPRLLAEKAALGHWTKAFLALDDPALYRQTLGWAIAGPEMPALPPTALRAAWAHLLAKTVDALRSPTARHASSSADVVCMSNPWYEIVLPLGPPGDPQLASLPQVQRLAAQLLAPRPLLKTRWPSCIRPEEATLEAWISSRLGGLLERFRPAAALDAKALRQVMQSFIGSAPSRLTEYLAYLSSLFRGDGLVRSEGSDFVRDLIFEVAHHTKAGDWQTKLTQAYGQDQAPPDPPGPGEDHPWQHATRRVLRVQLATAEGLAGLQLKLDSPFAFPMLLCDLLILVAIHHLWRLLRQDEEDPPDRPLPNDYWELRLQQHPLDVHLMALSFEEHARRYHAHHQRLEGPRGALLLLHAAYAGAITGLKHRGTWHRLLAERDTSDPAMNLSHALYELAHRRDVAEQLRTVQALLAAPPPELHEVLEAAGLAADKVPTTTIDPRLPPSPQPARPGAEAPRPRPARRPPRRTPTPR